MHVRAGTKFGLCLLLLALVVIGVHGKEEHKKNKSHAHEDEKKNVEAKSTTPVPCTCGIFLSGQFKKGSKAAPKGEPVITEEQDAHFAHNSIGQRQCANKCIESIIKYLPKSADIICSTIDRDCHKEKAYLFTKNYNDKWINSNMSAGRAFCCKDNKPYKCPMV